MPGQPTADQFTIQEQVRQFNQWIVNRQIDISNGPVVNGPVVLVLTMRDESDHLATDGITDEFRGVVSEGLAAFRCIDTVESQADGFLVCGQNVDGLGDFV